MSLKAAGQGEMAVALCGGCSSQGGYLLAVPNGVTKELLTENADI